MNFQLRVITTALWWSWHFMTLLTTLRGRPAIIFWVKVGENSPVVSTSVSMLCFQDGSYRWWTNTVQMRSNLRWLLCPMSMLLPLIEDPLETRHSNTVIDEIKIVFDALKLLLSWQRKDNFCLFESDITGGEVMKSLQRSCRGNMSIKSGFMASRMVESHVLICHRRLCLCLRNDTLESHYDWSLLLFV